MIHWKMPLSAVAVAVALTGCAQDGTQASGNATSAVAAATPAAAAAPAAVAAASVQRQEVAPALYEIAYSPSKAALYVASAGGFGPDAPKSKVLKLDPKTLAVQAEIPLPKNGFGVALDDQANRLYVGHTIDAAVSVIDTTTNKVIRTITLAKKVKTKGPDGKQVERAPHNFRELVLDTANHRLYLPGLGMTESALYVVDTRALKLERVVKDLPPMSTGAVLDAKGNRLFVSSLVGQISVIDTAKLTVSKKFDGGGDQLLNLAYDSATNRLFATDEGMAMIQERRKKIDPSYTPRAGNRVVVLNADSGEVLSSLATGAGPVALKLDSQRQRLYVTNREGGSVSVFDSTSYQPLQTVNLPTHPNSFAFDESSNVVFATVKNGKDAAKGSKESVARIQF